MYFCLHHPDNGRDTDGSASIKKRQRVSFSLVLTRHYFSRMTSWETKFQFTHHSPREIKRQKHYIFKHLFLIYLTISPSKVFFIIHE